MKINQKFLKINNTILINHLNLRHGKKIKKINYRKHQIQDLKNELIYNYKLFLLFYINK